jgi:hypothetical protein
LDVHLVRTLHGFVNASNSRIRRDYEIPLSVSAIIRLLPFMITVSPSRSQFTIARHRKWFTRESIARLVILSSPFLSNVAIFRDRYLILGTYDITNILWSVDTNKKALSVEDEASLERINRNARGLDNIITCHGKQSVSKIAAGESECNIQPPSFQPCCYVARGMKHSNQLPAALMVDP